MLTFSQYTTKHSFILELAKSCFERELKLMETIKPEEVYYVKDTQVVSMSKHALEDGQKKNRLWWTDAKDSNFINFANKVLEKLKNYDSLPEKGKYDIPKPERQLDTYIGLCDAKEMKGWLVALQPSKDDALDSCHVVTILNKHSGSMNMTADLFAKKDVYIVNVDKQTVKVASPEENTKKEISDIKTKLADLDDKHDTAYIEFDDEQDPKLKLRKKREYEAIVSQITNLKNRLAKIDKSVAEDYTEIYTVMNKLTEQEIQIILI